jgi:hypothetical protein
MTYQQFPVVGPFGGHVDNVPTPHNPPNSFDEIVNFICRKGRFQTRPRLADFGAPPDGALVRVFRSYQDVQNNLHTLVLTTANAYSLTAGATYNLMTYPSGVGNLVGTSLPYGLQILNNRLYFSNGSKRIIYADGETSLKDANAPGSARFLAQNASHLIAAYMAEPEPGTIGSLVYPQRVRWSKSGDPNDWVAFSAGLDDLLDVPDGITGLATLGRNTLIFRTNGLTIMTPTGIGTSPFAFENVSSSVLGIGNRYPYSLATYADNAIFIGTENIYMIDAGLGIKPIGGKAKKKIMAQLGDATGDAVIGWPVSQLGPGVDYLSYWLTIPGPDATWIYNFDEDNWQQFSSSLGRPTYVGVTTIG